MSTGTELERLQAIEARLVARWNELRAELMLNSQLVRRERIELQMRHIEDALGYRPRVSGEGQNVHA